MVFFAVIINPFIPRPLIEILSSRGGESAGNGERNQARQRATKQTAEPRAVKHEVRPVPPVSVNQILPFRFLVEQAAGYMGVPLFETKAAKYLKNVRGTICDSQVVENPETDRPNPAQVLHEVQPSRLLPIQISTFDYPEQAMRISGHTPVLDIRYKGIYFFRFWLRKGDQLGRFCALDGPVGRD